MLIKITIKKMGDFKKSLVKMILPKEIIEYIKRVVRIHELISLYYFDFMRHLNHAYLLNKRSSFNNLRAKLTFHYHAIEKGLSNSHFRFGFGRNALESLFSAMEEYENSNFNINDFRFQTALSVIEEYIKKHKENYFSVEWVEARYTKFKKYLNDENKDLGGSKLIYFNDNISFENLNFKELVNKRFSVRDFGTSAVDLIQITHCISIASNTPSVCNRQCWHVRVIKSQERIKEVLNIQNGFKGYGENLQYLIVVTADRRYMNTAYERNQTFVDGGLFAMSLLYSLTSANVASCPLNTNFSLKSEKKMREVLKVDEAEDFILVIAAGSFPEKIQITCSPKDPYIIFTSFLE